MIWKTQPTIEGINTIGKDSMGGYLDIEFTEVGDDYLVAKMPVDHRTVQPFRILHGGASVVLAETIGSIASVLCIPDMTKYQAVGIEINANHLSSAREGTVVYGTARPIRIGRTMHVWNIDIKDERGKLVCVSRLTVAIVERS
jgi:1,4-dihydroxy-2-naphthoyl-CoA hydrolase